MTPKPVLLLAVLTLCCCIASLHASPKPGCNCLRTTNSVIPFQAIRKIEGFPISGQCRRTEIIITLRSGTPVCVNPDAKWVKTLLNNLRK
ncbi:C-X-C motif chemokine 9 [Mastacembelus armatus]|nr:C-X-C motif chemokine 13 [Mastacembelus armatus]